MKKYLISLSLLLACMSMLAQIQYPTFNRSLPETYVSATMTSSQLRTVSKNFSVDKVTANPDGTMDVRLCVGKREYDSFEALGLPFTIQTPAKAHVSMASSYEQLVSAWTRYPTYETYLSAMQTFQSQFPDLCEVDTILSNTPGGHSLLVAHISNNLQERGDKPAFFYTSTLHGDEPVGYYLMLRLIHYLLNNYESDAQVRELVDNIDIWICPLENPDGTYYSGNNTLNESPVSTRYNYYGYDLNRSFPEIGQAMSRSYPAEVQAMMDFGAQKNFTMSANFHGGSEVFNYPWDTWETILNGPADQSWWNLMGHQFADTCHLYSNNYMRDLNNGVTEGGDWYSITGSRQDYYNYYLHCREVTMEVSGSKVVSSNRLPDYWNAIYHSLLNYMGESLNGVRGVVTDTLTGQPLEAMVWVQNHDWDNSQVYSHLPAGDYHRPIKSGTYQFTFTADGYRPKTQTLTVADGQPLVLDVQLVPNDMSVEEWSDATITMAPNPASTTMLISAGDYVLSRVEVYSISGKLLMQYEPRTNDYRIDVSALSSGLYIVNAICVNGATRVLKLVKE